MQRINHLILLILLLLCSNLTVFSTNGVNQEKCTTVPMGNEYNILGGNAKRSSIKSLSNTNFIKKQPTDNNLEVVLDTEEEGVKYQWYKDTKITKKDSIRIVPRPIPYDNRGINYYHGWYSYMSENELWYCENTLTNNTMDYYLAGHGWENTPNKWAILAADVDVEPGDIISCDVKLNSTNFRLSTLIDGVQSKRFYKYVSYSLGGETHKTIAYTTGDSTMRYVAKEKKKVVFDIRVEQTSNEGQVIHSASVRNFYLIRDRYLTESQEIANAQDKKLKDNQYNEGDVVYCVVTFPDGRKLTSDKVQTTPNHIIKQPVGNDLSIELYRNTEDAIYQWYSAPLGSISKIIPISTGNYAWIEQNGVWTSNNQGIHSSASDMTASVDVKSSDILTFDWTVSSETNHDYLTISVDGTTAKASGVKLGNYNKVFNKNGKVSIEIKYIKDESGSSENDCATISNMRIVRNKKAIIPIVGATSSQFTDNMGDLKEGDVVYCEVILPNGRKLISDYVTISKSGIEDITTEPISGYSVYNLNGIQVLKTMDKSDLNYLPNGIYIINGQKVLIK